MAIGLILPETWETWPVRRNPVVMPVSDWLDRLQRPDCRYDYVPYMHLHEFPCGLKISGQLAVIPLEKLAAQEIKRVHDAHHQFRHSPENGWVLELTEKHSGIFTWWEGRCSPY